MAIITEFNPEEYATSLMSINGEFIQTYMGNEVDVTFVEPVLDENNPLGLEKPLIWIDYRSDDFAEVGGGRSIGNQKKGQFGYASMWIWWFFRLDGGEYDALRLASKLKNIYLQHQGDLGVAKIRNPKVSELRIFKDSNVFLGGRQLLTEIFVLEW